MRTTNAPALDNNVNEPDASAGPRLIERNRLTKPHRPIHPSPLIKSNSARLRLVKKTTAQASPPPVRLLDTPWTERECLALALVTCNRCFGSGSSPGCAPGRLTVCHCVLRCIFRACYEKWRDISADQIVSRVGCSAMSPLGRRQAGRRSWFWARPREEYRADFELIARRALDARHYAIFRLHFVEGLDWKACCAQRRMSRGNFFHSVYRIEERLGKAYREAAPYALFPVYDYFSIAA